MNELNRLQDTVSKLTSENEKLKTELSKHTTTTTASNEVRVVSDGDDDESVTVAATNGDHKNGYDDSDECADEQDIMTV